LRQEAHPQTSMMQSYRIQACCALTDCTRNTAKTYFSFWWLFWRQIMSFPHYIPVFTSTFPFKAAIGH